MTLFLVSGKCSEPGVALGLGTAEPHGEHREHDRFDVPDDGHECERGDADCDARHDQRETRARTAAA